MEIGLRCLVKDCCCCGDGGVVGGAGGKDAFSLFILGRTDGRGSGDGDAEEKGGCFCSELVQSYLR